MYRCQGREPQNLPLAGLVAHRGAGETPWYAPKRPRQVMELRMNRKLLLSLAGGAAVVCIAYGTAQAAPAAGSLEGLKTLGLELTGSRS